MSNFGLVRLMNAKILVCKIAFAHVSKKIAFAHVSKRLLNGRVLQD